MKEIDLTRFSIGTYEFPSKDDEDACHGHINLNDITFLSLGTPFTGDTDLAIRIIFGEGRNRYYEGHFILYIGAARNLISYREGIERLPGNPVKAYSANIHCWKIEKRADPPLHSIVASELILQNGERNYENNRDVESSRELYLMKAIIADLMSGRLCLSPRIMVSKTTRLGKEFVYSFHLKTDETIPFNISIKMPCGSAGGYLETISSDDEITRYLI